MGGRGGAENQSFPFSVGHAYITSERFKPWHCQCFFQKTEVNTPRTDHVVGRAGASRELLLCVGRLVLFSFSNYRLPLF